MKKVFGTTMTILFLLVSFQQVLIIVHFKLNQKNIEQNFCVNQATPEMQCHGKCHLKKELEKSDNTDLELTGIGKKVDIALTSNIEFAFQIINVAKSSRKIIYRELQLSEPCLEIFIPPPICYLLSQLN